MTTLATLPQANDARSAEILARIRGAFAEKGFDGASMQDLARAAGMSVGNFYRYFPSKDAIVAAMVAFDMEEMRRELDEIHRSPAPMAAIRAKIATKLTQGCPSEDGHLWAEISAAAQRKGEIARICGGLEDMVAENLLMIFARVTGLAPETARARFGAHARFVVMMVKAAETRNPSAKDPDLDALILRSIDATLNEITASTGP